MSQKTTTPASPAKAPGRSPGPQPATKDANAAFAFQQALGNQAALRLFASGRLQPKLRVSQPGDADEIDADRIAARVVAASRAPVLHRKCQCKTGESCTECAHRASDEAVALPLRFSSVRAIQRSPATESPGPAKPAADSMRTRATQLIVEDDTERIAPQQMRKSRFLALLRVEACSAADAALASVGHTTRACPYIQKWLAFYENQGSEHVERAMRKYAPETAAARNAHEAIRLIVGRVERAALSWAKTGKVEGLPAELATQIPGQGSLLGSIRQFASSGIGGAVLGFFGGTGKKSKDSGSGKIMRKAHDGGDAPAHDAAAVKSQLGNGHALDPRVQSHMSSAFGYDFSKVRVHTDSRAAGLSSGLNARAFTVGSDVAFGSGEYKPGSLIGDALIAHELAHVVQQGGAPGGTVARSRDSSELEADADLSAAGAIGLLFGTAAAFLGSGARPRRRSGLRLQRCGKSEHQKEVERLGDVQLGFMEQQRKAEEEKRKKQAEEDAKKKGLPPPVAPPKVELEDVVKDKEEKHALKGTATTEWDNADQPKWKKRATDAWNAVVASVKGTELESVAKGVDFKFDPAKALTEGFYAQQSGHTLIVGMSWVRFAEMDPKNAWENLAHEMAGHFQYGRTYSDEIIQAALSKIPKAQRDRITADTQKFFEAYQYPETEIYASLWQRRYRVPVAGAELPSGGIHPDENIVKRLNVMKDALAPEVAKAVLLELKRRVDANDQILKRDKDFFVAKVKEVFKYDI